MVVLKSWCSFRGGVAGFRCPSLRGVGVPLSHSPNMLAAQENFESEIAWKAIQEHKWCGSYTDIFKTNEALIQLYLTKYIAQNNNLIYFVRCKSLTNDHDRRRGLIKWFVIKVRQWKEDTIPFMFFAFIFLFKTRAKSGETFLCNYRRTVGKENDRKAKIKACPLTGVSY